MRLHHRLVSFASRPHLPRRTVRLRLTVLYSCLFVVSGAVLLAVTYGLVRQATDDGVSVLNGPNGSKAAVAPPAGSPRPPPTGNLAISGGSQNLTPKQLQAQARRFAALAAQQHNNELHQLLTKSGIALAIMTAISVALGWFIAGRVLRPLRTITTGAHNISATNLHERLALQGPDDELKELGDTFDDLLGRLESSFDAQRTFVANASHELRTPLARQRTLAQVALADPGATVESLRAAHERVLATGQQQERLIEALLTLTRSQAGLAWRELLYLGHITHDVVQARQAEVERRELDLETTLAAAPTTGDPRLVERLIVNLVDNALRHNTPHGSVNVSTRTEDGHAILSINNDGPKVPPAEIDRLFLPLQRLHTDRLTNPDGLGLGLSIVQAIATAHDATLTATPRPDGGLAIEVSFAASPTAPPPFDANRALAATRPAARHGSPRTTPDGPHANPATTRPGSRTG
jgi:signal transduction histidine kinase